jgi:hypothetical protein
MFGLQECCTPCAEETVVNVPGVEGPAGADGTDGTNGANAFTVTTSDFDVPPADGATAVTVAVASALWMAVGMPLFVPGAGFLLVDAIIDAQHISVVSPDWEANTHAGDTIASGESVVASGWQPAVPALPAVDAISKYGVGTAYPITVADITTDPAEVTFGTSGNQRITLTTAGSWLL